MNVNMAYFSKEGCFLGGEEKRKGGEGEGDSVKEKHLQ